ncbi:MAG: NAD-glutamate dehydrogenase [Pseudomonadales bacterium]|nr:NAD-glutamate dehydrogenase [Pseudomonadales bacterium]
MKGVMLADKKKCMLQLEKEFKAKLNKAQQEKVITFARDYFQNVPFDDLSGKNVSDVYGQTLSAWKFIQEFDGKRPKIKVFNPDFDQHFWQSSHTIVMVLQTDMPFLVDSVRIELSRQEINIHAVQSIVSQVKRNPKGKFQDRTICNYQDGCRIDMKGFKTEAFMYFEIDRMAGKEILTRLEEELEDVLADVAAVVSDFEPMKAQVNEIVERLRKNPPPINREELAESETFLTWLVDQNFTFLGYKKYSLVVEGNKKLIKYLEDEELGLVKRKRKSAQDKYLDDLSPDLQSYIEKPQILSFAKSGSMARVHRPIYPDYIAVREFNDRGEVIGEHGFLGLYSLPVYTERAQRIPVLRKKVEQIIQRSGLYPYSHEGKQLARVIDTFPREELFLTDIDELFQTITRVAQIKERQQTRLFVRKDHYGKFFSCLVYMPKESYNTETRKKIQAILTQAFNALNVEFTTYFSESILVRTHFVLRTNPNQQCDYDLKALRQEIIDVTRSWQDELLQGLVDRYGEEQGILYGRRFHNAFPSSFRDNFPPRVGVTDVQHILSLSDSNPMTTWFYQYAEDEEEEVHFSLYHREKPLPLSDIIPILENMGLKVIGEHPYKIVDREGMVAWNHDFNLIYRLEGEVDAEGTNQLFTQAFAMVWCGLAANDSFNRLVLAAQMDWRSIAFIRACGRYLKQIRLGLSQEYIADTLLRHMEFTRLIVRYFNTKFDPDLKLNYDARQKQLKQLEKEYLALLDQVESLSEDRVLRRYLELNKAMLRTNFFQTQTEGATKEYISFKLDPKQMPDIPLPCPMYEIFVYSNRMEGVHLRGGKVARGGLRWSDRIEDYRTEVLGLVKAQQVKNAVIVPVGAKGGFVAHRTFEMTDREAFMAEGIACYKTFIRGLLDVSDNLLKGKIIPPPRVLRYDEDDPYLVVAADKGTATFSDISNGIAKEYGYWLGDAFASGGSQGYDHKGMGITARGAWVSVQRHFRERGLDVQHTDFTVVGIGDMAGDVFGNGMLLSEHIQLVAAFNHMHIFIDPNPNAAKSFSERKRLFEQPRSSWTDYDRKLISKGGGVYHRSVKSINVSPEMKQRFDIKANQLTPNDLINALLKSPVDMIWNGGIGTYVKATSESHLDVGDKANDAIRINGAQLRAKVVVEGGNLGMTQLGRVEYGLAGGISNTDAIDNAGGVDCSDHEVNIKILLDNLVTAGELTEKQRNKLLVDMTEDVATLVLENNYQQVQAISIAQSSADQYMNEYRRFITYLEETGKLNRALEFLPSDEELAQRDEHGKTLTRPELSVLISYSKAELKEMLVNTTIPDDDYMSQAVETAFPKILTKKYKGAVHQHQLRREIIATQLANDIVNHMGITYVSRMRNSTDAQNEQIAMAYVIARDIFQMPKKWKAIEALDNQVSAKVQTDMMFSLMRLVRHGARWLLRHRRNYGDVKSVIQHFNPGIEKLCKNMPGILCGEPLKQWQKANDELLSTGVPEALAADIASCSAIYFALDIIEATADTGADLDQVAHIFFNLANCLNLHWFRQQIILLDVDTRWHAAVRDTFRDDLDLQLRKLTNAVIKIDSGAPKDPEERVKYWINDHQELLSRWQSMQKELRNAPAVDTAMFTVAIRELMRMEQEE